MIASHHKLLNGAFGVLPATIEQPAKADPARNVEVPAAMFVWSDLGAEEGSTNSVYQIFVAMDSLDEIEKGIAEVRRIHAEGGETVLEPAQS